MVSEFRVRVSPPDEDDDGKATVEAVLRIWDRTLAISRYFRRNQTGYWLTWKFLGCQGPWLLQFLLTPLHAFNGILFSKDDIQWIGADADAPRLRITPFVPAEFWVDVHILNHEDRIRVAELIEQFWLPESHQPSGWWSWLVRRWPEAMAPLFLIPLAIGVMGNGEFWFRLAAVAFIMFVIVEMVLVCRQHAQEQRLWRGDGQDELPTK